MNNAEIQNKADYVLTILVALSFLLGLKFPHVNPLLWALVFLGALPTIWEALKATRELRISIDTFNVFAIAVSFLYGEARSAAFIILMLTFARILSRYTESRTRKTLEELLKLKPQTALREVKGGSEEILTDLVEFGDILIVKDGARIPVDGVITFGEALINEASVTGESVPVQKVVGDSVISSTLAESGTVKIRATRVGKDSTIERMASLVKEASKNKSRSEKLADRFATIYLPVVLVLGFGTYLTTRNIEMVTALFLVACADDMAVAIPLAVTAALGKSAKRGVLVKGGEWIEALSKVTTLVMDKTGTLTYGVFEVKNVFLEPGISQNEFWTAVAVAEKFSEHPVGRTIFKEAMKFKDNIPDPEEFRTYKGSGVTALYKGNRIGVGDYSLLETLGVNLPKTEKEKIIQQIGKSEATVAIVICNNKILGMITVGDTPKTEAKQSIRELRNLGVNDILMFTGDNEVVAQKIANNIGINKVVASMTPENKLRELEKLSQSGGVVAMVGDGVNDAAALARSDVGIAMGSGGAAVAVEAADVVVLNDDLSRLPELVNFSRKVMSVIHWDIVIWVVSNVVGFGLVFTGVAGPMLAALYNFVSDFFPLINSTRLFREKA